MKIAIQNIISNFRKLTLKDIFVFLSIALFGIVLDLYTKHIVFNAEFSILQVCGILNIVKVENYGISFGLFAGSKLFVKKMIILFNVIVCIVLFYLLSSKNEYKKPNIFVISISMIISGAIGNIIDRIAFGYVRDFIDFHIFDKHWPAFNIADSCVCIGVGLWIILEMFKVKNTKIQK